MELKLVYRVLRKISDWTIAGYYSETYVESQYNVSKDGPVIIASTHHNEIIDIATLAVTINARRPISFWAKSTMFANPITGAILSSSGAIPVRRNPNNGGTAAASSVVTSNGTSSSIATKESKSQELSARAALFLNTSKVLEANQVVGVFPEGASYTDSKILQILPGTAWAAVEYARYLHEKRIAETGRGYGVGRRNELHSGLTIVPVAIVYTNKSKYQSRIYVKYGNPILLDYFSKELFTGDPDESSKAVVKKITLQLQERLTEMTPQASDWDTVCAASMARDILWGDEKNVPLKDWVDVSQRLVNMLEAPSSSGDATSGLDLPHLQAVLTRYYALLHHSGISHTVLSSLLPIPSLSASEEVHIHPANPKLSKGIMAQATLSILSSVPFSLIRFLLFLPPLLLHLPGYLTGPLLSKLLSTPEEEETIAQYKAIGGGLGIGANIVLALGILWSKSKLRFLSALFGISPGDGSISTSLKQVLGLLGTVYCSVVVLVKWHKLLVHANYRQLHRIQTYWKLLTAFTFRDSLCIEEIEAYTKPERPAVNLFVRNPSRKPEELPTPSGSTSSTNDSWKNDSGSGPEVPAPAKASTSETSKPLKPRSIASRKLVSHVLHARSAACAALWTYLDRTKDKNLVAFLKLKGATISTSA